FRSFASGVCFLSVQIILDEQPSKPTTMDRMQHAKSTGVTTKQMGESEPSGIRITRIANTISLDS
ncbi:MAG: hypothetical protein QMB04_08550, partial [Pseudomonadales bacterium]